MLLIADSGSTKTRWACMTQGSKPEIFVTPGINPVTMKYAQIAEILDEQLAPQIGNRTVDEIYFYGAGCGSEKICGEMADMLSHSTGSKNVSVHSDLLGAARALCGHSAGIACILGTGSNSCLFNGSEIAEQVSPLGFILGDEGSGAVIGRRLIGNIFKHQLPKEITESFHRTYNLGIADIIERVYRQPKPNTFLASFMPFVSRHITHPAIEAIVVEQFTQFFKRNVMNYSNAQMQPVHFTGSVAYHFSAQLHKAAESLSLTIASIIADPLPQLLNYHE